MIRSIFGLGAVAASLVVGAAPAAFAQAALPSGERSLSLPPSLRSPSAPQPAAAPAKPPPTPRPQAQPARPPAAKPPARTEQARPAPARPSQPGQPAPTGVQTVLPVIVPTGPDGKPAPAEARPAPEPLTAERLRPSPDNVLDCKDAPKTAVTQVPAEIARWATVYCTKAGHVFTTNDRHFARFPRTPVLGRFNAAEMSGRGNDLGHAAHFTRIALSPVPKEAADALVAAANPANAEFLRGKPLSRLDLTVDTGQTFSMVLIDPVTDPFWVVTLVEGKPARSFFVATLERMNQGR